MFGTHHVNYRAYLCLTEATYVTSVYMNTSAPTFQLHVQPAPTHHTPATHVLSDRGTVLANNISHLPKIRVQGALVRTNSQTRMRHGVQAIRVSASGPQSLPSLHANNSHRHNFSFHTDPPTRAGWVQVGCIVPGVSCERRNNVYRMPANCPSR